MSNVVRNTNNQQTLDTNTDNKISVFYHPNKKTTK